MENKIQFMKPGNVELDKKRCNWTALEWINEFYQFLQGDIPEEIDLHEGSNIKLSAEDAFSTIWYLQEHMPVLPDNIEQCGICGDIYDSYRDGLYCEENWTHYCGACMHLAPDAWE